MDRLLGKQLGKYTIVDTLGEGGMAAVYKAFDPSLDRYVAVKVIRSASQVDPNFLARFTREAKSLAKLDHPFILKVLDYGEQDGAPYLVMPLVTGGTLKQFTNRQNHYREAIEMLLPIAEALRFAHQHQIIHRDIKPANILFSESGQAILSDFGIAKQIDAEDETHLTGTGIGIGTPDYMAPEQWNGVVDERTDIYALGIVLYELITGRCPYHANTPAAILVKQVNEPLPQPKQFLPNLPTEVNTLLIRALAKDPRQRYRKMAELIEAMKQCLYSLPNPNTTVVDQQDEGVTQTAAVTPRKEPLIDVPAEQEKKSGAQRKQLPWIIVGGIGLSILCVGFIVGITLWQLGVIGNQTPKTTATVGREETQIASGNEELATEAVFTPIAEATSTKLNQPTLPPLTEIEGLPEDVVIFPENNGDLLSQQADQYQLYTYSTQVDHLEVETYFQEEMIKQGWQLTNTTESEPQKMMMYVFAKDNRIVMIYVIEHESFHTLIEYMIPEQ